ncbi:MAG: hypothetical protein ACYTFA_18075, partial [Planctomycetota bacterium]
VGGWHGDPGCAAARRPWATLLNRFAVEHPAALSATIRSFIESAIGPPDPALRRTAQRAETGLDPDG